MANLSAEQALQIPQQLKRHNPHAQQGNNSTASPNETQAKKAGFLGDETVTLRLQQNTTSAKKIDVNTYKSDLGNESAYVRETLRNKLAELKLNPNTPLSVSKDIFGQVELKGPLLQTDIEQIKNDLEKSESFMQAFNRVSQQQPTLNYIDNVVKLSQAYGVGNSVFDSVVSENEQFNGLNDIAHRYNALRNTDDVLQSSQPTHVVESADTSSFSFVVN